MDLPGASWSPAGGAGGAGEVRRGGCQAPPPPQGRRRQAAADGVDRYIKSMERHKGAPAIAPALYGSSKYSSSKYTVLAWGRRRHAAGRSGDRPLTAPAPRRAPREGAAAKAPGSATCRSAVQRLPPRRKHQIGLLGARLAEGLPLMPRQRLQRCPCKQTASCRPVTMLQLTPSCLWQRGRGSVWGRSLIAMREL